MAQSQEQDKRKVMDEELATFLTELSSILVSCGYTAGKFGDIANRSFVTAASRLSHLRNGRVNQSRIAAITGLTRSEVKRLLAQSKPSSSVARRSRHRALRVLDGWKTDPDFTTKRGLPRRLDTSVKSGQFAKLVKRYSGDIPPNAILKELVRLGLVAVNLHGAQVAKNARSPDTALELAESLLTALESVSSELGGPTMQPVRIQTREFQATTDDFNAKILKRRTNENVTAFVRSMQEAARPQFLTRAKKGPDAGLRITRVSLIISESRVSKK